MSSVRVGGNKDELRNGQELKVIVKTQYGAKSLMATKETRKGIAERICEEEKEGDKNIKEAIQYYIEKGIEGYNVPQQYYTNPPPVPNFYPPPY